MAMTAAERAHKLGPKTHLAFFTLCEILVYFDRGIFAGLTVHLQTELELTSTQIGLLGGMFMLGYIAASPIFARLAQISAQWTIRSIAIGLIVWTCANLATGFIYPNFYMLIVVRLLTGVGEAGFCSLAPPIIDDSAPAGKSSTFLGVYFMALYVGQALGYVGSGFAWNWSQGMYMFLGESALMLPVIGLCFVWERKFHIPAAKETDFKGGFFAQMLELFRRPTYLTLIFGYSAFIFTVGGFAYWGPITIIEIFNSTPLIANFGFGAMTVFCGVFGSLLGGWLLDVLSRKYKGVYSRMYVATVISAIMVTIAIPFAVPAPWMQDFGGTASFFALMTVVEFFMFATTAPSNIAIMESVPVNLRGQAVAISVGVSHLFGDFPSPILMGLWNDTIGFRPSMTICASWLVFCTILWTVAAYICRNSVDPEDAKEVVEVQDTETEVGEK